MDIFNKLKTTLSTSVTNTIQNTVYHSGNIISGVIPGNPVTREFEITAHTGSAGPGLLWKIFSAVKKSTRKTASVFVLERSQLDKYDRQEREAIWELCKKGVGQLTRLRHPQILTVQHPLEESRDCLAFATEPVLASLSNVLGSYENLPSPLPEQLTSFQLYDVEIKYGLLQVSEGLGFLHSSARILHRNIAPESILINEHGAWKIAGFDYCLASGPGGGGGNPSWECPEYDHSLPGECYPQLDYSAPELALHATITPAADMFSYGMLAYSVHTKKSLYQCNRNWGVFKRNIQDLKTVPASKLGVVPPELVEYLKLLLSSSPDLRPTPEQVQQLAYFEDVGVKTLQLLDSQFQWDNLQKSQFYKGLPAVLPKLPLRVAVHRVYPCLAKEFVNPSMVPFVLPTALQIAAQSSDSDFVQFILPELKPVMKIMEPIQVLLIFMQSMDLLLAKTPPEDVKSDVLPMLYRALESDVSQIQELCLSILPDFAGLLDKQALKSALLPRIRKLCISTRLLSVRVNSLICVGKIMDFLDKWQVIDEVLPMLPQIPSKEPAVIMAIVGIYKIALTNSKLGLTKEVMANKVLPFLLPLSIENGLTVNQYDVIVELTRDMLTRIETEHRGKLKQLTSLQDEQNKSLQAGLGAGQLVAAPSPSQTRAMDSMFADMGLESYVSQDKCGLVQATVEDKRPQVAANTSLPKSASSQGLSLQEKQRILRDQELLQSQQLAGKDLLESSVKKSLSLNQFPAATGQPAAINSSRMTGNSGSMANSGMGGMGMSMGIGGSMAWGTSSNSSSNMPGLTSTNLMSSNLTGSGSSSSNFPGMNNLVTGLTNMRPAGSPSPSPLWSQSSHSTGKPDLSAFDSLLAPSQPARQPMNASRNNINPGLMQPVFTGSISHQQGQNNNKGLTQAEINDLLS